MKTIILFITLISLSLNDPSPQQLTNPYTGTWKYQSGNSAFIVSIWVDNEGITKGHYKKVFLDNNGNQISVIYNSKKYIGTSTTYWPYVMYAGTYNGEAGISGPILDITVSNSRGFIEGQFTMTIVDSNSSTLTAHWELEKMQGLREPDEPDFNIPTDIILTKVSNVISLD